MKVKKIIYMLLTVILLLVSCTKDLPDSKTGGTVNKGESGSISGSTINGKYLRTSVERLSFNSNAGNKSFNVTSNVNWQVICYSDWVVITESTTSGTGNGTITVGVMQNSEAKERTATIYFSSTDAGSVEVIITQSGANVDLKLSKNVMSYITRGGNDSFEITCNTDWAITVNQTWCTADPSIGSGNRRIIVSAQENTSLEQRQATITVKAGDLKQSISVSQVGANATLKLNKSSMSFDASGGNDNFMIDSNTSWTITNNQSWCTVSSTSGVNNGSITVNVSENTSTDSRVATITVNAGEINQTIHILQNEAKPVYSLDQSVWTFKVKGISFKGVSFNMIRVDGGTFTMGVEKTAHCVTLSTYYIGETEVTEALYEAVMGRFSGSEKPVDAESWNGCQIFIKKLNSLTGMNFRLPTEAEWEFAARGGNSSQGYKYSGYNNIDYVAWYKKNAFDLAKNDPNYGVHSVASKWPNELGLYDMSGNVCEWCQDWYGSYSNCSQTNPTGPSSGRQRVVRGGSWRSYERDCFVWSRYAFEPGHGGSDLGLRLALSPFE